MSKYFLILFLFISLFSLSLQASQRERLIVNIISRKLTNGAGKEVDVQILEKEFKRLGHLVNCFDYDKMPKASKVSEDNSELISESSDKLSLVSQADINIFLAQFKPEFFPMARLNWFMPNAEFCLASEEELKQFDLILCKTQESVRIFEPLANTYFLGFTTIDHYEPRMSKRKDFTQFLHVAGKSRMKGTRAVVDAWNNNPDFPELVLLRHFSSDSPTGENIDLISRRISSKNLLKLQNKSGFHVCPSKTEGFGHSLIEAMSVGSILITTDAPPMNEFIKDKRCLVKCRISERRHYATTYSVEKEELELTIRNLLELPLSQLKAIGQQNRKEFLRIDKQFRENFQKLMQKTSQELPLK